MTSQLPSGARRLAETYPDIWNAYGGLGEACANAGPLDAAARRLVKLALAVGAGSEGAVHSHARRAIEEGVSKEAVYHVAMMSMPPDSGPSLLALPPSGWAARVPWRLKDALLAVVLVGLGTIVALPFLTLLSPDSENGSASPLFLVGAGLLEGLLIVAVWVFGVRRYRVGWTTAGLVAPQARNSFLLPWLALVASLAFGAVYAAAVSAAEVDSLVPPPVPAEFIGEGATRLLSFLFLGVLGPVAEEVFFRGFLLTALARSMGPIPAMVVSSAVFGAAHGNIAVMIPLFVTGLLLSWLYLRTRSIWPPAVAHIAQNVIALSLVP